MKHFWVTKPEIMLTETDKNIAVFYHTEKRKQNITDFVIFQLFFFGGVGWKNYCGIIMITTFGVMVF